MNTLSKRLGAWALIVALLLTIPLIAMRFTSEVNWTGSDFIFAGALLFGSACVFELIARKGGTSLYRFATAAAVLSTLGLMWVNGAVGLIGSENNAVNALYFLVPLVGVLGMALSRLTAFGLAATLFAMAAVQILIPIGAFIAFRPDLAPTQEFVGIIRVFGASLFFAFLFAVSGILFRHAAEVA